MAAHRKSPFALDFAQQCLGFVIAALFLAPLAWTALSSLKPAAEAALPPLPPWPSRITYETYQSLDGFGSGLVTHTANSLFVALGTVGLSGVVSLLAGYGFSRFHFPLKNVIFVLIISTMMIPYQSLLTPLFLILSWIGLSNSLVGLVLVYATLQLPFSVFMMRNAFEAVPREIDEAARIDGCGGVRILTRIMLPLVAPGIITVSIFAFLASWNEFLAALILLTDNKLFTLPILVTAVRSGQFGTVDWGAVQAGVTLMMMPCLLLFLLLQRYYMRGLTAGAVK